MIPPASQMRSAEYVAAVLDISVQKVRRLCRAGDLPAVKIGNKYRIHVAALDDYLAKIRAGMVQSA